MTEVPHTLAGMALTTLSASRASDFMTCPLLFRFRSIDRLPEQPSAAAVRGTLVHSVLEHLFDAPPADRTPEYAATLVAPLWQEALAENPDVAVVVDGSDEEWIAAATKLVDRYFALEDPRDLEPAAREHAFEVPLDSGLVLRGFIDRIDVSGNGLIRIVDYKTGKSPSQAHEGKALFQMRFYALAIWRQRDAVPHTLQLLYLGSEDSIRHQPTESELVATERKIDALRVAIDQAWDRGEFAPKKGPLCGWCDHKAICPAWGGTPPPMPTT